LAVNHVAIRTVMIFTKFEVGQPIHYWLLASNVLLLIRYVTLSSWPLTLWPWTVIVCRLMSFVNIFLRNRAISNRGTGGVTALSICPIWLPSTMFDFTKYAPAYQISTQSGNALTIELLVN